MVTPAHHLELAGPGDLARESDTPRAHDAAVLVELDQVRDILARVDQPLLHEPVAGLAVMIAIVLQSTFPGLVADGAVERMVQQQVLHDHPLVFLHLGAVGHQDGQVLRGCLAARDEPGHHLDLARLGILGARFDLAHPAVGHDRQSRVPAIVGNVDPDTLGHLDRVELLPLGDWILAAVDDDGRHRVSCSLGKFRQSRCPAPAASWPVP